MPYIEILLSETDFSNLNLETIIIEIFLYFDCKIMKDKLN